MQRIPTLIQISNIILDESACITWLIEHEIIKQPSGCEACNGAIVRRGKTYRCTKKSCRKETSIFRNSFFAGSRLKCSEVVHIAYMWLTKCNSGTVQMHTGHSTATISAYFGYFRQLVSSALESDDAIIGGPGIVVRVDETKMGKRKYHRGHRVEGAWVVVGVEITDERRTFAEVVQDRSADTIAMVLGRHIAEGSILHTDCWRAYGTVASICGLEHCTVNHSEGFKNSETGVHTNHVEGTNFALKRTVPIRTEQVGFYHSSYQNLFGGGKMRTDCGIH